jgi:hypothetical protein
MLEPVIEVWKYLISATGVPIEPGTAALVTVGVFVTGLALWAIRKSRREFKRIADHLRVEFDAQVEKMNKLQLSLQGTINRRVRGLDGKVDALHALLKPTEAVTSTVADSEITEDNNGERELPRTRLGFAATVRSTVMDQWLNGMTFKPSARDANIYEFEGHSEAGHDYFIVLTTPYRASLGQDGRMPFALDIWVNNRKHLNFEWDAEGKYALRGFKRGEWLEDVGEWRMRVGAAQQVA